MSAERSVRSLIERGDGMFVQVISGRVRDAEQLRTRMDRWIAELSPNAEGWLGSTTGVTADGIEAYLAGE